ncbi:MAG: branched-chain-amino-acid transaminase [Verrucomicrobiota bacterium]
MDKQIIYVDGEYLPREDAKISVFDHGLLYGDGVFEGIRVYNNKVFLFGDHLDRLYDSAKAIMLNVPLSKDEMKTMVLECCRRNQIKNGYVRLVVTRGAGDLGLGPERCPRQTVICIAANIALYPEECYRDGLKILTSPTQQMNSAALSPAIKSLNYLNNIMAKVDGQLHGMQEAVMLNAEGYVAECSGDNIFTIKKGRITTPPIAAGALDGITRGCAIKLCEHIGTPVREANLQRYDLWVADEIFLTGTGAEIIPVVEVDKRMVGDGKPGPFTRDLISRFRDLTQQSGTPIPKEPLV